MDTLKEALKGDNNDDIKNKMEDLQKSFYAMSTKLYEAAQAAQQQGQGSDNSEAGGSNAGSADYVDADYVDADDNSQQP